jgi:hypothetical protein
MLEQVQQGRGSGDLAGLTVDGQSHGFHEASPHT